MTSRFSHRLVRATPVLAMVAPFVIFGFLYALAVQPQRASAQEAAEQAATLRAELDSERALVRRGSTPATEAVANAEFERRTPEDDLAPDVADAITALANSPAVGGVTNLSIEIGSADGASLDPRFGLFQAPVTQRLVTVAFDAEYTRIGRFFWNLRTLPSTYELRSLDLEPAVSPLMHARVALLVVHRIGSRQPTPPQVPTLHRVEVTTAPEWSRDPFAPEPKPTVAAADPPPDPVVQSILFSANRRVALVDGRIVTAGDKVGSAFVRAIDVDAVTVVTSAGLTRRLPLQRPVLQVTSR